jgi:hypothetical protein
MRFLSLLVISGIACCASAGAQDVKKLPAAQPTKEAGPPNRQELEKRFGEQMSGATLVGHFTDRTREDAKLTREEKYTLGKVSKLQGDTWLFQARIQYGEHDVTLPLPLRVVWAGDTPVITLDKVAIPGFGMFTCRVMIFGDQYAGTWDGGNHGGHLFGKVVRKEKDGKGGEAKKADTQSKPSGAGK